jgi:hypothetical protein
MSCGRIRGGSNPITNSWIARSRMTGVIRTDDSSEALASSEIDRENNRLVARVLESEK